MRVGLHALGIGAGARPEVILAVAGAAEAAGFATLWAGEHVVLADQPTSRYPYVAAMRTLWANDVASFSGEFTRPVGRSANPHSTPLRNRHLFSPAT